MKFISVDPKSANMLTKNDVSQCYSIIYSKSIFNQYMYFLGVNIISIMLILW